MANKFLTTQKKRIIAMLSMLVLAYAGLTLAGNPFNLPTFELLTRDVLFKLNIVNIAAVLVAISTFMLYQEQI